MATGLLQLTVPHQLMIVNVLLCYLLKMSLQLGMSEWSDRFSLDTVGSIGTVECKLKDQIVPVS